MERTVLVVDDDVDILAATSSMLGKRGVGSITAMSAEEALDILKKHSPDMILTDVLLPQMNGYEFLKMIRTYPPTAGIPVIVMTGRAQMKDAFEIAGVAAFIAKPFSPEQLMETIFGVFKTGEGSEA